MRRENPAAKHDARLRDVRAFLFDVDGVLTVGGVSFTSQSFETKTFHVADAHGLRLAVDFGIRVGFITGSQSHIIEQRARELGITDLYQGSLNKLDAYEDFRALYDLRDEEIAYMGDSMLDVPVLRRVGFSCAPRNAHSGVRIAVHYVTRADGGAGAVREVVDMLLRANGQSAA